MATAAPHIQSSRASPASLLENASGSDSTLAAAPPPPPPANPVGAGKKAKPKKGATDQTDAARQLLRAKKAWEVCSAGKGSKGGRWYAWAWLATASPRHARPSAPGDGALKSARLGPAGEGQEALPR